MEQIRTVSGSHAVQLPVPRLGIYYMTEDITPSDQVSFKRSTRTMSDLHVESDFVELSLVIALAYTPSMETQDNIAFAAASNMLDEFAEAGVVHISARIVVGTLVKIHDSTSIFFRGCASVQVCRYVRPPCANGGGTGDFLVRPDGVLRIRKKPYRAKSSTTFIPTHRNSVGEQRWWSFDASMTSIH